MRVRMVLCLLALSLSACQTIISKATNQHIKSVSAVTEVFGDGQKSTAAIVEYDTTIKNTDSLIRQFSVDGSTVTKVYANDVADKSTHGVNGRYVVIELSPTHPDAALFSQKGRSFIKKDASVSVKQLSNIETEQGSTYSPSGNAVKNTSQINRIVDDFRQQPFTDPQTGVTVKYNLFIPKNYNPSKNYPLVMFIHDAGTSSPEVKTTLTQGLGAVIWASPEEQAKHEAFVLAPQFDHPIVNDQSQATADMDATIHLIQHLGQKYAIDNKRLYATGQSGGGMMSIAMNIKYPNFFAASYLVACQWDEKLVSPMAQKPLWIVVSEGDLKAYPGMNAITSVLEKNGAKVARAVWNGTALTAEFAANISAMRQQKANVYYVALKKGTVVPAGQTDDGGGNHVNTWRIAYNIEGIRDWLFAQRKP